MVDDKDLEEVGKAMATHLVPRDNVCPRCGAVLKVGDWPWCPHDGKMRGGFKLLGQGWTPRG